MTASHSSSVADVLRSCPSGFVRLSASRCAPPDRQVRGWRNRRVASATVCDISSREPIWADSVQPVDHEQIGENAVDGVGVRLAVSAESDKGNALHSSRLRRHDPFPCQHSSDHSEPLHQNRIARCDRSDETVFRSLIVLQMGTSRSRVLCSRSC
jgi:hypothetical protein